MSNKSSNWAQRMKIKAKLLSPVGITLTNSEAKILLDGQLEAVKTLEQDQLKIKRVERNISVDYDDAIKQSSAALNMARGTYSRTKNPVLKREWARRLVIADKTTNELVQAKKRTSLVIDRLKMIAGDMELEMLAAKARAAETKMYVEAGDTLRLVGDKLIQARAKSKPMQLEYDNLEVSMEGAEKLVNDMDENKVLEIAEMLAGNSAKQTKD